MLDKEPRARVDDRHTERDCWVFNEYPDETFLRACATWVHSSSTDIGRIQRYAPDASIMGCDGYSFDFPRRVWDYESSSHSGTVKVQG